MTDAPTESVVLPLLGALSKAPTLDGIMQGEPDALVFAAVTAVIAAAVAAILLFARKPSAAMKADEFQPFRLIEKEEISHDTRKFTFALQTPKKLLGLPVGQHISLRFTDKDGKNHQRSYTPVSGDETPGTVTFVIKVYKAGVHPKFPDGGKMSQHLDSLSIGDTVDMRGPKGHLTYLGQGKFTVKQMRKPLSERCAKHFGMIAGGTGITPCLQVIHAILRDSKDTTTTVSLLYANQSKCKPLCVIKLIISSAFTLTNVSYCP
uniref:FAD-binding FR-type domain-containing protein n=1 Tax=Odontella aurita TaxID=265563 RepID=A0A7S4KE70_9STRA|mmetsp:Transcript_9958/g.29507  ORF Transcript_9958/g.29507 Transcript_9958/m.29507 type:complete len:263 (+) Transcript_9958:303-1091(+)